MRRAPVATDPTPEQRRQAIREVLAIERFAAFAQVLWKYACPDAPDPTWAPHMDVICDEIQAVVEESDRRRAAVARIREQHPGDIAAQGRAIEAALGNAPPLRLVLLIPPRGSKSKLTECLFPAWRWLHRPQDSILALSSSETLIEEHGLHLRDVLRSPEYQSIQRRLVAEGKLPPCSAETRKEHKVPDGCSFGLRADEAAKAKFGNTAGGGRSGYALGAKYTGADADITIIDDPHDVDEAMAGSPESQQRAIGEVVRSYRQKVQDRSNNKLWSPIILIMQRVHVEDLAAYMIRQPGARVVCLPAEYDPEHEHRYAKDWRTVPGELLDPVRLSRPVLDFMRQDDAFAYATKFLMHPTVQEGTRYRREWFEDHLFDEDPQELARSGFFEEVILSVDAANRIGRRNDFTSIGVWGRRGLERYLLDRWHGKVLIAGLIKVFREMCAKWPMAAVKLIEDKANGAALADYVETVQYGEGGEVLEPIPGIVRINPKGDKRDRSASYAEPVAAAGRIRLPRSAPWRSSYVSNMVAFDAGGTHDDDIDMTSQALHRWAARIVPWLAQRQKESIACIAPGWRVGDHVTRWDRPTLGGRYWIGLVPGWSQGQFRGESSAVVVDERGRIVALVEALDGGWEAFAASLVMEARFWKALSVRYAESPGRPAPQMARRLCEERVPVLGRPRKAGETGRRPGEVGAGWNGERPAEVAELWTAFLGSMDAGVVGVRDARVLEALETIVESPDGLPRMPDGSVPGGRTLAFLLALRSRWEAFPMDAARVEVGVQVERTETAGMWPREDWSHLGYAN